MYLFSTFINLIWEKKFVKKFYLIHFLAYLLPSKNIGFLLYCYYKIILKNATAVITELWDLTFRNWMWYGVIVKMLSMR